MYMYIRVCIHVASWYCGHTCAGYILVLLHVRNSFTPVLTRNLLNLLKTGLVAKLATHGEY